MQTLPSTEIVENGVLAQLAGKTLPVKVMRSNAGFYLGTEFQKMPFTRESVQYFKDEETALYALDCGDWNQRQGF